MFVCYFPEAFPASQITSWVLTKKVKSLRHVQLFATPWTVAHTGSSVHGILQAGILEWVASSFSRGSFPTQGWNRGLPHFRQTLPSEPPGKLMGVTFPLIFPHPSGMTWYVSFSVWLVSLECGHQYVHRDLRICPWTLLCNPLRFRNVY